jgi:hypothetical protein
VRGRRRRKRRKRGGRTDLGTVGGVTHCVKGNNL